MLYVYRQYIANMSTKEMPKMKKNAEPDSQFTYSLSVSFERVFFLVYFELKNLLQFKITLRKGKFNIKLLSFEITNFSSKIDKEASGQLIDAKLEKISIFENFSNF